MYTSPAPATCPAALDLIGVTILGEEYKLCKVIYYSPLLLFTSRYFALEHTQDSPSSLLALTRGAAVAQAARQRIISEISGSYIGEYEDGRLLGLLRGVVW
jgi:hypothetical protein